MAFRGRVLAPVLITLTVVLAVTGLVASPASAAPVVSSFTPTSGGVGTPVTITGSGFTSVTAVTFNATAATYTVTSATHIRTTVPAGATTGKISVTAGGVTGSSATNFTVTLGSAVSPSAGPPTAKVNITGSGFGANEAVDLYAGTSDVALVVADANGNVTASTTVPSSAPPGTFWFTLVGRRTGNASQVAFTVRTNLMQSGFGPGKTAFNPYENQISGQDLDLVWSQPASVSPVVVNGVVVTESAFTSRVVAYTTGGAAKWSTPISNLSFLTPAVIGSTVVVASSDGHVRGLSLTTGAVLWTTTLASTAPVDQPVTVTPGGAYVVQQDGRVTALTPTGAISWSKTMDSGSVYAGSAASVAAGLLVTGDNAGSYYAWSLASGDRLWKRTVGTTNTLTPVVSGNLVIASDVGGDIGVLDLTSGHPGWFTTDPDAGYGQPAVGNGRIFLGFPMPDALSRSTGVRLWTSSVGAAGNDQPFLANGVVWVAGDDSEYFGLDASTGQVATSVGGFTSEYQPPEVADGQLYAIANGETLNVFAPPNPANPSVRPHLADLHPDHSLKAER